MLHIIDDRIMDQCSKLKCHKVSGKSWLSRNVWQQVVSRQTRLDNAMNQTTAVKLVLLGEAAVGKSSLVLRFVNDDFQENKGTFDEMTFLTLEPTIGAAFLTQRCTIGERTIKFEIWDTAGQERFASLAPMYYRNAQAAVVVYDVTKPASFIKARHWVKELQEQATKDIIIALCGNKLDLVQNEEGEEIEDEDGPKRKVSVEEGKSLADEEKLLFFETSAKSALNVNEVFVAIAKRLPEPDSNRPQAQNSQRVNLAAAGETGAPNNCAC